jgi:predicted Rossmann-fold nucleotide-binding protein
MKLDKVISGGQTGVDRAGLDAAMEAGIPVGGYCPKGRLAEDGAIPRKYPMTELMGDGYPARTEKNVMESDGTLILNVGTLSGGTRQTLDFARKHGKPCLVLQLDTDAHLDAIRSWIEENEIRIMNIAGPRESKCPGLYIKTLTFLRNFFREK